MSHQLETIIGYKFKNPELLEIALTHTSYANESRTPVKHNERLEFLGDSVLQIVSADYLFHAYADRLVHRVIQFAGIFVRTGEYDAVAGRICISFYMLAYLRKELAVHNGRYDTYGAAASAADLGCRIVGYITEALGNLAYARNRLLLDLAI